MVGVADVLGAHDHVCISPRDSELVSDCDEHLDQKQHPVGAEYGCGVHTVLLDVVFILRFFLLIMVDI